MNHTRRYPALNPDLLRTSEVCHRLSIHSEKLAAMCRAGLFKVVNIAPANSKRETRRITWKSYAAYLHGREKAPAAIKDARPGSRKKK